MGERCGGNERELQSGRRRGECATAWFERDQSFGLLGCFVFFCFPKIFSALSFHCRLVFTGEVWLGYNHIGPSIFFLNLF